MISVAFLSSMSSSLFIQTILQNELIEKFPVKLNSNDQCCPSSHLFVVLSLEFRLSLNGKLKDSFKYNSNYQCCFSPHLFVI